jgi:hypothetical protein
MWCSGPSHVLLGVPFAYQNNPQMIGAPAWPMFAVHPWRLPSLHTMKGRSAGRRPRSLGDEVIHVP